MAVAQPMKRQPPRLTPQHRGLRSYVWRGRDTLGVLGTMGVSLAVVVVAYDSVIEAWWRALAWAWPHLGIGEASQVHLVEVAVPGGSMQSLDVALSVPGPELIHWWAVAGVALALTAASLRLSRERLPAIYFLRLVAALCAASLVVAAALGPDAIMPADAVLNQLLTLGMALLWSLPLIHALVLYIFPQSLLQKLAATLAALLLVAVGIPLQVGTLAWLLAHGSQLVVLPIHLLASFLPQLLGQLGVYGFFMSLVHRPPTPG
ncbi:MAG: hypothetical protein H6927_08350 [Burkholderiaceae bacterium]|nr:hypothetical protein [Pseudomonadota bacterium]MBS0597991.1 hypothetical protein [Pseudomonadota bacterium]MCO5117718.1 hypothetical protein [Burkholderiaceae bacterium]MCP5218113.1 hypothetical protein [Burkholderiaceae bacterium]